MGLKRCTTVEENNSGLDELGRNWSVERSHGRNREILDKSLATGLSQQRNAKGDLDIEAGSLRPVPPEQIRNIRVVDTAACQDWHCVESEPTEWQWTKSNAMTPE